MSRKRLIVVFFTLLLVIWGYLQIFRDNYSPDVLLAKNACGLVEFGNDLEWLGISSFPTFSTSKPVDEIGTRDKYEKWVETYKSVIEEFSQQAEYVAEAAHIDSKWRSLADAKSEYVYAHRLYFILENDRGSISELQAEMSRLQLKLEIVIKSECGALANKLNS